MIHIIRASHANQFELQNYAPLLKDLDINVITSHSPLTSMSMPSSPLWSPTDLPAFPLRKQILNRAIGGEQWLVGLENMVKQGDIVHTAETYTPYTHQAVELKKRGIISKLICTCWETIPHNNEKFARLRSWKAEAYEYVDLFHTPTERAKQALIVEGVAESRIQVIPYGVDLAHFSARVLPIAYRPGHRPQVLTVARLEKEKGMQDLEIVAKSLPDYAFLVVGAGSYIPAGPNITVKSVGYDEIAPLYRACDVFFLPSKTTKTWEEQYGMALVEAMASALPIVTTDSGAISEVVGSSAVVVPVGDIAKMVEAIDGIITYRCNVLQLSRSARARAERLYDAQKVAKRLSLLYV